MSGVGIPASRAHPEGGRKRTLAQDRVAKGLCPQCGKEAAPYRLCNDHRSMLSIDRVMRNFEKVGGVEQCLKDGKKAWRIKDKDALERAKFRPMPLWGDHGDAKPGDKRTRPRIGGVPVDLEAEIIKLVRDAGRPVSIEDIVLAWGRLRENRQAGTIASNVAAIVAADQRRAAKNAKRARAAGTLGWPNPSTPTTLSPAVPHRHR